jgi:predicted Zn-ribbon and HTH transcriptional regulator
MEESTKKLVMIVVVVVCLAAAADIAYKNLGGGKGLIPTPATVWIKCTNPDCNAEYQMKREDYLKQVREVTAYTVGMTPIRCEKCGKDTAYLAIKCPKCGFVFVEGMTPDDVCPNCGWSTVTNKYEQKQ